MLAQTNYISNAHRLDREIADTVKEVYSGQLFQINAEGKFEYADGTQKAYPTLNDRDTTTTYGLQKERIEGRDNVTLAGKIACLKGNYEIGTDQYDKDATYTAGAPLCAKAGSKGQVTVYDPATAKPWIIVGVVTHVPESDEDFLRYEG